MSDGFLVPIAYPSQPAPQAALGKNLLEQVTGSAVRIRSRYCHHDGEEHPRAAELTRETNKTHSTPLLPGFQALLAEIFE